eukprot:COSAG01_NODE_9962_length_2291_cov_1.187956_4_plen_53_part_01
MQVQISHSCVHTRLFRQPDESVVAQALAESFRPSIATVEKHNSTRDARGPQAP